MLLFIYNHLPLFCLIIRCFSQWNVLSVLKSSTYYRSLQIVYIALYGKHIVIANPRILCF